MALEWLEEVLPAAALGIQLLPVAAADESLEHVARSQPVLLTHGAWPLDNEQFDRLIEHIGGGPVGQPLVVNRPITDRARLAVPRGAAVDRRAAGRGREPFRLAGRA